MRNPYRQAVYGKTQQIQDSKQIKQQQLPQFLHYLNEQNFNTVLDLPTFLKDLNKGIYFHSTILTGYGMGSSGALCAGIFSRYKRQDLTDLSLLKTLLGKMESFFHGSSSGIDPLICYLQKPLLLKGKEAAEIIDLEIPKKNGGAIFLLDTKQPRQTEPLVKFFLESLKKDSFNKKIETELCVYNQKAINAFLNQNEVTLFENLAFDGFQTFQAMQQIRN